MKKILKTALLASLLSITSIGMVACGTDTPASSQIAYEDLAASFKFDENSNRAHMITTVHTYVDGDTVHFNSDTLGEKGVLKTRFLGIDTPESTGKVQPWGKAASKFTKNALSTAAEIMLESGTNDGQWNLDSTATRYLTWIWYRPSAGADWKLLNLEILQNGYAAAKNIGETCYATVLQKALSQAMALKLHVFSDEKDPDYCYNAAEALTIKEIRDNLETYKDKKVQFEGLVTRISNNTAYTEDYDEETGITYGMPVYMGFSSYPFIQVGNIVSFIGTLQLYETAGTYQVSGLTYMAMKPDYAENSRLISENNEVNPTEISADDISTNGEKIISTNVTMSNLTVTDVYTTKSGTSEGAMTLTCSTTDNKTVTVRTEVIYNSDKSVVTASQLNGKVINIHGIVDKYEGEYQIRVFLFSDITFVE